VSMVLAFVSLGACVLASLPMLCASWYLLLAPPPAKQLRRIGWTLVAVTVATAICMLAINFGQLTESLSKVSIEGFEEKKLKADHAPVFRFMR